MRLSRCLLAELRPRPQKPASTYEYTYPWLRALKVAQLTDLAQATGIRSAGPKDALSERLDRELQKWEDGSSDSAGPGGQHSRSSGPLPVPLSLALTRSGSADFKRGMSVLSIDMGIKNLAYAHFIVPGREEGRRVREEVEREEDPLPILNAWRRIDMSRLPVDPVSSSTATATATATAETTTVKQKQKQTKKKKATTKSAPRAPTTHDPISPSTLIDAATVPENPDSGDGDASNANEAAPSLDDEEFWPLAFAPRAYTLVTTLLDTYKPTHVLIERQRFRTHRAASVFETTLRVGVFEGMLYSIFWTLARERAGVGSPPLVVPVEPSRVGRFLAQKTEERGFGFRIGSTSEEGQVDGVRGEEDETDSKSKSRRGKKKAETVPVQTKKPKLNNRHAKNVKIDLVGMWLASAHPSHHSEASSSSSSATATATATKDKPTPFLPQPKLEIAPDELLHRWIDAYLNKWPGLDKGSSRRRTTKPKTRSDGKNLPEDAIVQELPKLDDLADSLVQGITWLEWMRMRDRVAREGARVLVPEGERKVRKRGT